jgi:hypothetical protein
MAEQVSCQRRVPANKGMRYPTDPPTVEDTSGLRDIHATASSVGPPHERNLKVLHPVDELRHAAEGLGLVPISRELDHEGVLVDVHLDAAVARLHLLFVILFVVVELLVGQVLFALPALLDCGHGVVPFDSGWSQVAYPRPRSAVVSAHVEVLARTANGAGGAPGGDVRDAGENPPMEDHGLTAEQKAWVYEQLANGVSRDELSARLRRMGDLIALEQEGVITIEPLPNGSALVVSVDPSDW